MKMTALLDARGTKSPQKRTPDTAAPSASAPANPALAAEAKIARIAVTVFPLLVVAAGVLGFFIVAVILCVLVAIAIRRESRDPLAEAAAQG